MIEDLLTDVAHSAWALPLLAALVLGDAFLVVVPGEIAVTAYGALAVATGAPPLTAVIAVAAAAAFAGDLGCFLLGRSVGIDRWPWMRARRAAAVFAWARRRLSTGTVSVVFTARFIPFARLAVTLTAGATGVRMGRFLGAAAAAASAWAVYQAVVGAVLARLLPGGPVVAVTVAVAAALVLGLAVDGVLALSRRRLGAATVASAREDG